jgi:FtsP/CotA-like multicopper oxidase with cupredoxin domain
VVYMLSVVLSDSCGLLICHSGVKSGTRNAFIYDFIASDEGTYWIHSHDPGQYPKGIRTPLIVKPRIPVVAGFNYGENDYTVTLSDW